MEHCHWESQILDIIPQTSNFSRAIVTMQMCSYMRINRKYHIRKVFTESYDAPQSTWAFNLCFVLCKWSVLVFRSTFGDCSKSDQLSTDSSKGAILNFVSSMEILNWYLFSLQWISSIFHWNKSIGYHLRFTPLLLGVHRWMASFQYFLSHIKRADSAMIFYCIIIALT